MAWRELIDDGTGCDVQSWDCDYSHAFYEHSTCDPGGTCICEAGLCGFEVMGDGIMQVKIDLVFADACTHDFLTLLFALRSA